VRGLCHEHGAFMNEDPENCLEQQDKESIFYEPKSGSSADTKSANSLILNFTASKTMKNNFLLFITHTFGIFIIAKRTVNSLC
jgi:hypothetical protein